MRLRLSKLLVLGVLASALLVTAGSAATSQFASGMVVPETITQTAAGFLVTDATATNNSGKIFGVPAGGGAASLFATTTSTLRGAMILPSSFSGVGGQFLVVGSTT
jgi:hypothetical protein